MKFKTNDKTYVLKEGVFLVKLNSNACIYIKKKYVKIPTL